ncbi:MAG TPA: M23 family metallopeptidase [Acidobacteriota bacterium]|nr:M23 family metallopeptidase [Acidobacteriota bacterium]
MRNLRFGRAALIFLVACSACAKEEIVPEPYQPSSAWDAYRHGLDEAGLASTALARDWIAAAASVAEDPVRLQLPYRERGAFDARAAHASGYGFTALRGQRIEVVVDLEVDAPVRLFLDLFRIQPDAEPLHVASAPATEARLAFEPRRDAEYLLRLQPELLRGGEFELEMRLVASLEFPVEEHDVTDIQSAFGAARDAGRRTHHGVDIFARRGTPALAASRAYVRRVGEQRLGGNVVWLQDRERDLRLYYAHLESQAVEEGSWVEPGDVIGYVGNSGNARTTPPHLHFAIYSDGPIDPMNFLRQPRSDPTAVSADASRLGSWGITMPDETSLHQRPSRRSDALRQLGAGTPLRIWAATGGYYRVALADGTPGFLRDTLIGDPPSASDAQ